MIEQIVELPNRYHVLDSVLNTELMLFPYDKFEEEPSFCGRKVPLDMIANNRMHKYKVISFDNNYVVERIFMTEEHLDTRLKWWTSNARIYPIQKKMWSVGEPICGHTFKYVIGISEMIEEEVDLPCVCPVALSRIPGQAFDVREDSLFSLMIPSLDSDVYGDWYPDYRLNANYLDVWVKPERRLSISPVVMCTRCNDGAAQTSMDAVEEPFDSKELSVGVNPINNSWAMYDFLMQINDLAVPMVTIDMDLVNNTMSVDFKTPYMGFGNLNDGRLYDWAKARLFKLGTKAAKEAFGDKLVKRIFVKKLWSEEIYMTVYFECPERSSLIDVNYYVDLPVLMIGTVGLR